MAAEMTDVELTREKIHAEIAKLMAETSKINAEIRWYPFVAAAGVFGLALGTLKLLHG